eukprot:COSAG02_NODE_16922_length_1044_cov_0.868783_2_plen_64_part_00
MCDKAPHGTQCGLVAPLTKEHGMSADFDTAFNIEYTGIASTVEANYLDFLLRAVYALFAFFLQ